MGRISTYGARTSPSAMGGLRGRVGLVLAIALSSVLLASLSPAYAQEVSALTFEGPTRIGLGIQTNYFGKLTLGGLGVPLKTVEITDAGAPIATAQTADDGTYSVPVTLFTYGFHELRAVVDRGTPLEVKSAALSVEAVPDEDAASVADDLHETSEFIYSGPAAVQTGVAPGTIKPERVAVLRGAVTAPAGDQLSGVTVTTPGHAEFGESAAGSDGVFDMALNGGQSLVVRLERDGYLPVERSLDVPWRDYAVLDDIVMTPLDSAVTAIQTANSNMQVARANSVTDGDGTRRATLLFPSGTQASMTLPDGSEQALSTLNVRASEFTVGAKGPEAMPATLPPASAYTYAVEFSVDEALAADASKVTFNQTIPFYVENFLDFAVGAKVPVGYYDRARHAWVGSKDGRVIKVLSETSGLADLDTDGDGSADSGTTLAALGITDAERERVATLYEPGQSLWRVAVDHFTPWDLNWPFGLPSGARGPGQDEAEAADADSQCTQDGSIIGCEGQTLGEVVPLAGTPYHLRYDSSRALGRSAMRSLRIPLSGSSLPPGLKRITLDVTVAGRSFHQEFTTATNLVHLFNWDGKDAYGRLVQGRESAQVSIGYVYDGVYWNAGGTIDGASWGATGTTPTLNPARQEITLYQRYSSMLGAISDAGTRHLGGWSLSAHHVYDYDGRALYRGDGATVRGDAFVPAFKLFAGNGDAGSGGGTYSGDGGPARLAGLARVKGLTVGADGSVYIADWGNGVVRRVGPDGIITRFAGGGVPASGNGDGGPALDAELISPTDMAFGPDGSLFISDSGDARIRRVATDGTISTFAGGGNPPDGLGDGLRATEANLSAPRGIAVGQDGTVYIVDTGHDRVRAISRDGVITTLVGGGTPADGLGDGKRGPEAALLTPLDVAVGPDGSVYVADADHDRIRRVDPSGEVSTFAGTGDAGYSGDGGQASAAALSFPSSVAVDASDGRVYVAQRLHHVVRQIDSEGIITTIAGTGTAGYTGSDGPPAAARMKDPQALAVGHNHEVLVADTDNFRVRMIDFAMPGFATTDIIVPSQDGSELYHFDKNGRHLRTLDALTGVATLRFSYDTDGRLISIKDPYDNTTTIERNGSGLPTAIVSPFGRSTQLTIGADGYLESVTNPNAETTSFDYDGGGLLISETQPGNRVHAFTYNPQGRLITDDGPGPGFTALDRTEITRGHRVTVNNPAGRATTYEVENLASGSVRRTVTRPWGGVTRSISPLDGSIELTAEDGTTVTSTLGPDPRFGLMTPIPTTMTTTTPAAKQLTMSFARSVTLADPNDPLSLTGQTDTVTSNNKTVTRAYDKATQTLTTTSAEGRQGAVTFNDKASVVNVAAGGLAPVSFTYDLRGRVATVTRGTGTGARTTTMTYDAQGFLDTVTNPASETTSFDYDGVGRVKKQILADTNQIAFDYDGVGNLSSLTPPGRSAHGFDHDTRDLLDRYGPPALSIGATDTTYAYTHDKAVDSMTLPTGEIVDHQYDSAGRLDAISFSRGLINYAYTGSTAKLASITAPGAIALSYSFDGPLLTGLSATGDAPGTVGYGYDTDLRVSSRTLNGGNSTAYTYDKDGLLTAAGPLSLSWGATNGLLSSTALGSVTSSHTYNGFGEPQSMEAAYTDPVTSAITSHYSVSYTRDALGRIETKTETIGSTTTVWAYEYDARGRLIGITKDGAAHVSYAYDANGNRESVTEGGNTVSATFDAQDRLTSQGTTTYQYTKDGQLLSKTASSATTTYDYDEMGLLMEVASPTKTVSYKVDGLGRRVVKKVDGAVTNRFLYGQGIQPIAELDATGSGIKAQFIYAGQGHVPDVMVRNGVTYRFVTDQVGSVRLVVSTADGTIAQRIDYNAFGKVTNDTDPGFQPFGFAGGLYDPDTALVRFGARDYDAEIGRWTAKDPLLFDGEDSNLYAYVGNDPVNLIDPAGDFAFIPVLLGAWAVVEIGLSIADAISTAGALADPCQSGGNKALAAGIFLLGVLAPGGGGSTALRYGDEVAGGIASADEVLEGATRWLGPGYREIAPGVFRSADNTRQFRMAPSDLRPRFSDRRGPHVHFESIGPDGRTIVENTWVRLPDGGPR